MSKKWSEPKGSWGRKTWEGKFKYFNGKVYMKKTPMPYTKQEANRLAKAERKKGNQARLVKIRKKYDVYVRE